MAFAVGDDVFRWTAAGIADVSLNGSGEVRTASGGTESGIVDPNQRLVFASDASPDIQLYRYLEDGTPDPSFGVAGEFIFDVFASDRPLTIMNHPAGGYVLLSESDNGGDVDTYVTRITDTGAIDATYAAGGSHQIDVSFGTRQWGTAVALEDGSVVAATRSSAPEGIRVTKLDPDGALDLGFAGGGEIVVPVTLGSNETPRGIDAHPDGSIAITGHSGGATFVLLLDSTGVAVPSFGTGGEIYNFPMSSDVARSVVFEPDGKLLIGGRYDGGANNEEAYIARIDRTGAYDSSFGTAGFVTMPGAPGNDGFYRDEQLAIGIDGTIYALLDTNAESDLTVYALAGNGTVADYANGVDDWNTASPNDDMFGACLVSVAGTGSPAASAPWADSGSCGATDADPWQPIDSDGLGATAKVMEETTSGATDAVANIRFGFRTAANQPAGSYMAAIVFEAAAPNV